MSKSQREKGKRGELDAAKELRRVFPNAARKVVNHAGMENGVDLVNTGALDIQVKNHKAYVSVSTIDTMHGSGLPVVVTKAERKPWRVIMNLSDLLAILEDVGIAHEVTE